MRYLLFLFSLLLSVSTAFAQTEKAPVVTKLPGEENLSLRERAERDFLMPVRRKKVVTEAARASAEDGTASPESDVTAHATDVADEVRTSEEVAAPVRETRAVRHSAVRKHTSRSKHTSAHKSKASRKSSAKKSSKKASAKSSKKKASSKKSSTKKSAKKSSSKKAAATKKSKHTKKRRR